MLPDLEFNVTPLAVVKHKYPADAVWKNSYSVPTAMFVADVVPIEHVTFPPVLK